MRMIERRYGWLPDVPDSRDFLYKAIRPRLRLPPAVDLRFGCSPVEDQGKLGSCTAQALAGNIEYLDYAADQMYADVSRLFIYYNERVLHKTAAVDSGAMLRDGIQTLAKQGVCHEEIWPYAVDKFADKPTAACYRQALQHKIVSYHRLSSLDDMFACLADGFPFVFGMAVYESFASPAVARTGTALMPKKTERLLGGHAVMAVGYDQKAKRFLVRNSWGAAWGREGYFTIPFEYLETLARDFWTIRK
ncbi:MAG: C1 family peptidase [Candidatus Omnitrophica bacterium]|nr:C1 family peptidase [Candidatus Omnitrophota bacterium]